MDYFSYRIREDRGERGVLLLSDRYNNSTRECSVPVVIIISI